MDRLISEKAVLDLYKEYQPKLATHVYEFGEALKAIPSAEPSGDLISRQAAIKSIEERAKQIKNEDTLNGLAGAVGILFELPSVKPQEPKWIPVSERLPEEDGDYFVTYEKGYAEDYDSPPIGIVRFEVDCESFGYWHEHFDRQTLGSLGSEWEEINVIAWMPLPKRYEPQESEDKE